MPTFKRGGTVFDMGRSSAEILNDEHQSENIARSASRIGELERIVAFLIAKMLRDESISLQDAPVRRFLRIPEDAQDDPEKYLQLALNALEPVGLLVCTSCDSKVRDIPGFLDETCPICGAHVGSER